MITGDVYITGIGLLCIAIIIAMVAFIREKDDLHRLILTDSTEVICLSIIAFLATDLAEALILPGLVVSLAELLALSEIYINKEGLTRIPARNHHIEALSSAPPIMACILVIFGVVLSGFTGGAVAGIGIIFYFMCLGHQEQYELLETISGFAWAFWVIAFFIFMILPAYWYFAVMIAGSAICAKVMIKLALIGTMKPSVSGEDKDHV